MAEQNSSLMDRGLQAWMNGLIHLTQEKHKNTSNISNDNKTQVSLLMAGYAGSRNTGADVRVSEMIRQMFHIMGKENLALSVLTIDPDATRDYFEGAAQKHAPQIFPPFLFKHCPQYDGVIACEGSMFKSKFADALSTFMAGALGMANAQNKLSIGYGAEAGHMTPALKNFVQKHCENSLIICRNLASQDILEEMKIRTTAGTDTAWTYPQPPKAKGEKILLDHGWDGKKPILAICPIDPFCWPVKPSLPKTLKRLAQKKNQDGHYKSIYFFNTSEKNTQKFMGYIQAISNALKHFQEKKDVFPILVGMEKLDRKACLALNQVHPQAMPMFISDQWDMDEMVAILHQASILVSSRFHAIVCSMSGLVPSAGITMDERILNLLTDRGDTDLLMQVDQDNLENILFETFLQLDQDREGIQKRIAQMIPRELQKMGHMGMDFSKEVQRVYPHIKPKINSNTWEDYLPALSKETQKILEQHA